MSYSYKILKDIDTYDSVRTILGVTTSELSDTELDLLPMMPAADRAVVKRFTNYVALLADADKAIDLKLGAQYITAANVLPTLRLKLLQIETDNKTSAQRFKTALDASVVDLLKKADEYLSSLETAASSDGPLIISTPATNVITGDAQ